MASLYSTLLQTRKTSQSPASYTAGHDYLPRPFDIHARLSHVLFFSPIVYLD